MRTYTVKGKKHIVYDLDSELPDNMVVSTCWKKSRVGDWVRADDGAIIQVLAVKKLGDTPIIKTCIGTYSVKGSMDTSERENRSSLSGKANAERIKTRNKPTQREILFAQKIAYGERPVDAYLAVYNAKSRNYASRRAALLMKTERITTLMNPTMEELKSVFSNLGVDLTYLIQSAKDQVDAGKNGSDKLGALKMLWEAYGVVEKKKITEIAGIFQGFEPKELENIKRPELAEYQPVGDEAL